MTIFNSTIRDALNNYLKDRDFQKFLEKCDNETLMKYIASLPKIKVNQYKNNIYSADNVEKTIREEFCHSKLKPCWQYIVDGIPVWHPVRGVYVVVIVKLDLNGVNATGLPYYSHAKWFFNQKDMQQFLIDHVF